MRESAFRPRQAASFAPSRRSTLLLCALFLTPLAGLVPTSKQRIGAFDVPEPGRRQTHTSLRVAAWYDGDGEQLGADAPPLEGTRRRSTPPVSYFSPSGPGRSAQTTEEDLFLPPPVPEPVREGEFGEGRYGDAGGGRTEGYWAALQEAPDRLRASDLNELLQPDHMDRLRFANFPMQAYGALFKWEVLVDDPLRVYREPWVKVAEANGLSVPDDDVIFKAVGVRPERVIQQFFGWTDEWGVARQLAFDHYEAKAEMLRTHEFQAAEGAVKWLELLNEYQVPCCLCAGTSLDKPSAEAMAERAGFDHLLDQYVTAEDGCETTEQTYLVSCIKVRRPPERCVVFEDDQWGVVAAHEATAKAIAVLSSGSAKLGELRNADARVSTMDELSLMSLRELFKGVDLP